MYVVGWNGAENLACVIDRVKRLIGYLFGVIKVQNQFFIVLLYGDDAAVPVGF